MSEGRRVAILALSGYFAMASQLTNSSGRFIPKFIFRIYDGQDEYSKCLVDSREFEASTDEGEAVCYPTLDDAISACQRYMAKMARGEGE